MSKRAESRALEAYPVDIQLYVESKEKPGEWLPVDSNLRERIGYQEGYEAAEKDIITIIQSRLSEIIGDAQPKPILRAELEELINRIKDEN